MIGRRKLILTTTGLIAAVAAGIAVAQETSDRGVPDRERAAEQRLATFGVMRRERTREDVIPLGGTERIRTDPAVLAARLDWDRSRLATAKADTSVYVVPGAESICMVIRDRDAGTSTSCARPEHAADGILRRIGLSDGVHLIGLVPDGIRDLELRQAGRTTTPTVRDNAFIAPAGAAAATMEWTDAAGVRRTKELAALPTDQ